MGAARRSLVGLLLVAMAALAAAPAVAASYPTKPVRIIAPFSPGGGTDVLARIVAKKLSESLNQQFVVENKTGASGGIGSDLVAKSPADGYTLLMGSNGPNATNAVVYPDLPYDPRRDFAPISLVALVPNVLLVTSSTPANSVQELIALARSKPGELTFGSAGVGTPAHLAAELFKSMAHVDMLHVPYKGGAATLPDLLSGRLNIMFADMLFALPQVRDKKLRALAVTTSKRSRALPELPTIAEAGLPGYDTGVWYGLFAPAGTPKDVIGLLNAQINEILTDPEVRQQVANQGGETAGSSPEELKAFVEGEVAKWTKVFKDLGIGTQQ